jgi:hypothetical protein
MLAACGATGSGVDSPGASPVADGAMPGRSSETSSDAASSGAVAGGPSGTGMTSSPVPGAVTQVSVVGTKIAAQCDPNYSGACVPIASDVDCAGGSGNGPAYVQGPVRVVGRDIYGLDSDGDGIGCE